MDVFHQVLNTTHERGKTIQVNKLLHWQGVLICSNPWPRWLSFWNFETWSRPTTFYTTNYLLWRVIVLLRSCSCRQFQSPVIVHHCVGRFAKRTVRGRALRGGYISRLTMAGLENSEKRRPSDVAVNLSFHCQKKAELEACVTGIFVTAPKLYLKIFPL